MIKYFFIIIVITTNVFASDVINFTFLGTGTPRPDIDKLGPSILIKNGDQEILLDAGRGTSIRLNQIGNDFLKVNRVFISHLHYDHIIGLPDFWLTSNLWQKKDNMNIYGPKGIKKFCQNIINSYTEDINYRYEKNNYSKLKCHSFDTLPLGVKSGRITINFFKNSHGHIEESYGFKIKFNNKTVVYSGDTSYSQNVIDAAKNCDILIHEVIASSKKIYDDNTKLRKVFETHTNINQLIKILNITNPKLTILNHALLFDISESEVLNKIKKEYNGDIIFSKDLMSVDLGKEISIFDIIKYN